MLWLLVNLGGKYWQIRWEAAAERLETLVAPDAHLFAASKKQAKSEVVASIARSEHKGFAALIDRSIVSKPSVRLAMTALSLSFVFAWAVLVVRFLLSLGSSPN